MRCPNCGASIYDDVNRCQYCGSYTDVKYEPKKEPEQPKVIYVESKPQPAQRPIVVNINRPVVHERHRTVSGKNRTIALLLCVFLGYFGIHRFYEGKTGSGTMYLFTLGLFGIGWLADCVVLLLGHPKDSRGLRMEW